MKQNMIWPLFKILASHFFSFGTFFEGFKKGVKGILKNILVIVLILYFLVFAGGMYIAVMNSVGNGLLNSGDIEKMLYFGCYKLLYRLWRRTVSCHAFEPS